MPHTPDILLTAAAIGGTAALIGATQLHRQTSVGSNEQPHPNNVLSQKQHPRTYAVSETLPNAYVREATKLIGDILHTGFDGEESFVDQMAREGRTVAVRPVGYHTEQGTVIREEGRAVRTLPTRDGPAYPESIWTSLQHVTYFPTIVTIATKDGSETSLFAASLVIIKGNKLHVQETAGFQHIATRAGDQITTSIDTSNPIVSLPPAK